jgi:hypothetical protein
MILARLRRPSARIDARVVPSVVISVALAATMIDLAVGNADKIGEKHLSEVSHTAVSVLADLPARVDAGRLTAEAARAEGARILTAPRFEESGQLYRVDFGHSHRPSVQARLGGPEQAGSGGCERAEDPCGDDQDLPNQALQRPDLFFPQARARDARAEDRPWAALQALGQDRRHRVLQRSVTPAPPCQGARLRKRRHAQALPRGRAAPRPPSACGPSPAWL